MSIRQAITAYLAELPAVLQGGAFSPADLAADRAFVTPVEHWLTSPRILRAMRCRRVPEEMLTGACADYEKMTELLFALAYTAGDTLPADIATDLSWLLGDVQGKEPTALWQETTAAFADRRITPRTLLGAHRAALLPVSLTEADALSRFSHTVYPLLDISPLLWGADFSATCAALSDAFGKPITAWREMEQLLGEVVCRFAQAGAPAILLDISGYNRFLRPDPYHAGLAFDRLMRGEVLTDEERAVFTAQLLRTVGAVACAENLRIVLRVRDKTEHIAGDFSPVACKRLLRYLAERRVLPDVLLTLPAGELPQGLALLLDVFQGTDAPRLSFGMDGAGASVAALRRSLRFYLSRGAAASLVGITDCDKGFFTNPSLARFARVLAAELADFVENDMPEGFPPEAVFRTAAAIYTDNAANFFGLA